MTNIIDRSALLEADPLALQVAETVGTDCVILPRDFWVAVRDALTPEQTIDLFRRFPDARTLDVTVEA